MSAPAPSPAQVGTIELDFDVIVDRLRKNWPVTFYSQYYKKFMFASRDKDWDYIVEFGDRPTEARIYWRPSVVENSKNDHFRFFSDDLKQYIYGATVERDGSQMVLMCADKADTTEWRVFKSQRKDIINAVRLFNVTRKKFMFVSNNKADNDQIAELSTEQYTTEEDFKKDYAPRQDLQVIFGKPLKAEITNLHYELDQHKLQTLPAQVLTTNTIVNEDSTEKEKKHTFTYSTTNVTEWGNTTSVEFGTETSISAGVPFIVDGQVTVSSKFNTEIKYGQSKSETKTFAEEVVIKCPPKSSVTVDMMCQQGAIDVPFTATITMFFDDGTRTSYDIKDTFRGVCAYKVSTKYHEAVPIVDPRGKPAVVEKPKTEPKTDATASKPTAAAAAKPKDSKAGLSVGVTVPVVGANIGFSLGGKK